MIDRKQLLDDLKPLLRELEADLRARCDEVSAINEQLTKEYEEAKDAERTGVTFEEWRADLITQVGAAWILSCVFVRFLEDNALIEPPRISGPSQGVGDGRGLGRARDEWDIYLHSTSDPTHRGYLLQTFDELGRLPGTKDVFGPHNLVLSYRDWLSGDAAQLLIGFFQKIDTEGTGDIVHDFSDPNWDTRFLGDLYQDLSETARKKYALLQTPIFVEEFILERTLEPAIAEFGLVTSGKHDTDGSTSLQPDKEAAGSYIKMIDPACGSGHFLLGSFERILRHWRALEPGTNQRELVNRTLASIHGVDLNPYAIAIARFRLLLVAMRECEINRLAEAPKFKFNLACGDSLLHGIPGEQQKVLGFHELAHHYLSEDVEELRRILAPGKYHAVVANPPYITVKDNALNQAYRRRYPDVCYGKYSLSVPFLQWLFVLACDGGFTGQITANSFMKAVFGQKVVESYLPAVDLTHVIDSAGAYIPGHGTPTVILFGRNRPPVMPTIRAVLGINGEPTTPANPASGLVWAAIRNQIDLPGSQSSFVSVSDTSRERFSKHPWSIGGGGAAELKKRLDEHANIRLGDIADSIGITSFTLEDDMFLLPKRAASRHRLPEQSLRRMVIGDIVRDWSIGDSDVALFPYDREFRVINPDPCHPVFRHLWNGRTCLQNNVMFGRKTKIECGLRWYEYGRLTRDKLRTPFSIVFPFVATHNHFVLDRGGKVFNRPAPVIKLPATATENDYFELLGPLNSSVCCFWLKQVCHNKGSTVDNQGARQRTAPFEDFYAINATNLQDFPLACGNPDRARQISDLAQALTRSLPSSALNNERPPALALAQSRREFHRILGTIISLQEEMDWECYQHYGLLEDVPYTHGPPSIQLGERAFEIVLARKIAVGEEETTWFERHHSIPVTEIPGHWPAEYRDIVKRRIEIIENNPNIALIEKPEYKRRWNLDSWDEMEEKALRGWLLDRLESYFDLDGRMNDRAEGTARSPLHEPRLISVAGVADIARTDNDFMQVAQIFTNRMDFDIGALVNDLVSAESVPALPILRYKPSGLDKRAAWERTWELQRLEDAIDSLFEPERLQRLAWTSDGDPQDADLVAGVRDQLFVELEPQIAGQLRKLSGDQWMELAPELINATDTFARATNSGIDPSKLVNNPIHDAAKQAKKSVVGQIPVPPKYTDKDFLSSDIKRLRGKLDVPKERWVSFPNCEGEDGTLVIAWAGYDHLQLARAIAERYEIAKEQEGRKLVPLLAAIGQLIPWLKQWHNQLDPTYGARMGEFFVNYLAEEAKALGRSVEQLMAWVPPERPTSRRRKAVEA